MNLGDLPTWLGVLAASVAAVFVYLQLRSQQKEIARQVAALERQQADQVEVLPNSRLHLRFPGQDAAEAAAEPCWSVTVINSSRRPIRNVQCRIEPAPGQPPAPASMIGIPWDSGGLKFKEGTKFDLVRAESKGGFAFAFAAQRWSGAHMIARFTDDAGLHWQIDHDLHLQKLNHRDW